MGWDFEEEVWSEIDVIKKRVDYSFRINGIDKFFIEAKPLKADLDNEIYIKQAINYSWNKGVTWAVLTDFESIKIFNAQSESKSLLDKLVFELPCSEYLIDFERLWLLSKESFKQNGLDEYATKHGKKLKKLTVNDKLYDDLKKAREILTLSMSRWNEKVDKETIEEGVQRILDRLVFMRVLEDKGLESPILKPILRQWEADKRKEQLFPLFIKKFRELDDVYNSNIFKKHACEDWEEYDDSFKKVIELLYGTHIYEYDFKEIPADILGGVYESYLGYIAQNPIKVDKEGKSGKLLEIEDKKEIKLKSRKKRKEQGIYYTPKFVVDYIVNNTLGKKLEDVKSIAELKKIRVLDPACGSGSFLTAALRTINKKYKDFGNRGDQYTKSCILLENIYGVDLDPQAVELAKLNLLIEALDEKAKLPDLTGNVRVGNSLISGNKKELEKYFGKNWRDKRPFNWQEEFKEVFDQGGFDVIIGNPPYIRPHKIDYITKSYLWKNSEVYKEKCDIYAAFIEKSIKLLKIGGLVSFIVPHTWLSLESFKDLRLYILENCKILSITQLKNKIFKDAQVETLVFVFQKSINKDKNKNTNIKIFNYVKDLIFLGLKKQADYHDNIFDLSVGTNNTLLFKIAENKEYLHKYVDFFYGLKTADDKKFITNNPPNKTDYKKLLRRSDVGRYVINFNNEYVYYRPDLMIKNKSTARPGEPKRFEENKIIIMDIAKKLVCTLDDEGYYVKDALILKEKFNNNSIDIKYLTALINSKLLNFYYRNKYNVLSVAKNAFFSLPIAKISDENKSLIVKFVDSIISLNKQLKNVSKNSEKWNEIKKEIEKTDKEIDQKVYELYGLTEEEIRVVEN